jgi:hypothetical protein
MIYTKKIEQELGQHGTGIFDLEESAFLFGYTKKGFYIKNR